LRGKIRFLRLSRNAYVRLVELVKEAYPAEACGVLAGRIEGETANVIVVEKLRNILSSPSRFWFNVGEWMDKILRLNRLGLEYIGLFHSHSREEPILSMSDMERMLECPGEIWLVAAYVPGRPPRISAWRMEGYGISLTRLKIVQLDL